MKISAAYPFESKYAGVRGSKIHYIEKGEGPVFLFLHGNPTWSYLWRNVIPPVAEVGRCIAPDLIGFGKSDKPDIGYGFLDHYSYVEGFIDGLQLKDIIVVGHDWGGVLGFYYALNNPGNVRGIAFMESFPFTFAWSDFPARFRAGFRLFRAPVTGKLLIMVLNVFVNRVIPAGVHGGLSKEIHARYKEPFPTIRSRYPVYAWAGELPVEGSESETFRAITRIEDSLREFTFPVLLFTSSPGGIIRGERVEWLKTRIRNLTIEDVGAGIHYLQEDNPGGIASGIVTWAKEKNVT